MNSKTILDYLHTQFPATIGNIPIQEMLDQLQKELDDARSTNIQALDGLKYIMKKVTENNNILSRMNNTFRR
jgi:hypothetical protein